MSDDGLFKILLFFSYSSKRESDERSRGEGVRERILPFAWNSVFAVAIFIAAEVVVVLVVPLVLFALTLSSGVSFNVTSMGSTPMKGSPASAKASSWLIELAMKVNSHKG